MSDWLYGKTLANAKYKEVPFRYNRLKALGGKL